MAANPDGLSTAAVLEVAVALRWCDPALGAALGEHALRCADSAATRRSARLAVIQAVGLLDRRSDVVERLVPHLGAADADGWLEGASAARAELALAAVGCDDVEAAEALVAAVEVATVPERIAGRVVLARTWIRAARGDVAATDVQAEEAPSVARRRARTSGDSAASGDRGASGGLAVSTALLDLDLLRARAAARRRSGDLSGAVTMLRRAREGASSELDAGRRTTSAAADEVELLLDLARTVEARELAEEILSADHDAAAVARSRVRCLVARRVHLPVGELDQAESLARVAEDELGTAGHGAAELASTLAVLSDVAVARGRLDQALAVQRRAAAADGRARDEDATVRRLLLRAACGVFGALPGTDPVAARDGRRWSSGSGADRSGVGSPGEGPVSEGTGPASDDALPGGGTRRSRHRADDDPDAGDAAGLVTALASETDGDPAPRRSRHRRADPDDAAPDDAAPDDAAPDDAAPDDAAPDDAAPDDAAPDDAEVGTDTTARSDGANTDRGARDGTDTTARSEGARPPATGDGSPGDRTTAGREAALNGHGPARTTPSPEVDGSSTDPERAGNALGRPRDPIRPALPDLGLPHLALPDIGPAPSGPILPDRILDGSTSGGTDGPWLVAAADGTGPVGGTERPTDALDAVEPGHGPAMSRAEQVAYDAELALTRAGLLAEYTVGDLPPGLGGDRRAGRLGSLLAEAMDAFHHGDPERRDGAGPGGRRPHPDGSAPPADRRPVTR